MLLRTQPSSPKPHQNGVSISPPPGQCTRPHQTTISLFNTVFSGDHFDTIGLLSYDLIRLLPYLTSFIDIHRVVRAVRTAKWPFLAHLPSLVILTHTKHSSPPCSVMLLLHRYLVVPCVTYMVPRCNSVRLLTYLTHLIDPY